MKVDPRPKPKIVKFSKEDQQQLQKQQVQLQRALANPFKKGNKKLLQAAQHKLDPEEDTAEIANQNDEDLNQSQATERDEQAGDANLGI